MAGRGSGALHPIGVVVHLLTITNHHDAKAKVIMNSEITAAGGVAAPRRVFRNPADGRLRAGWRIAVFILVFYSIALPLLFGIRAAAGLPKGSPLLFVIIAAAATLATLIGRRFIDGKTLSSLGLRPGFAAALDLGFGFLLSGLMAGSVFAAMAALGIIADVQFTVTGPAMAAVLAGPLLVTAIVGYWEELVFRGYLLQNMAEGMGMRRAVIVSCLLYGLVHAANPNAGLLSTAIIVLFGYLRIYGYLGTGQLWLSMGMHWGWNFFQGAVFGFAASGHAEAQTLIAHEAAGADWLSGGAFGPEASVLTVPVVLLAILAMRAWSARGRAGTS